MSAVFERGLWLLGIRRHNKRMPIEPQQERLFTVKEAARMLEKSEQAVRNLCQRGRIPAQQIGREWLIPQSSIDNFKPGKAGRPRNEK